MRVCGFVVNGCHGLVSGHQSNIECFILNTAVDPASSASAAATARATTPPASRTKAEHHQETPTAPKHQHAGHTTTTATATTATSTTTETHTESKAKRELIVEPEAKHARAQGAHWNFLHRIVFICPAQTLKRQRIPVLPRKPQHVSCDHMPRPSCTPCWPVCHAKTPSQWNACCSKPRIA